MTLGSNRRLKIAPLNILTMSWGKNCSNPVFGSRASFENLGSCEFVARHDFQSSVATQSYRGDFRCGDAPSRPKTSEIPTVEAKLNAWFVTFGCSRIQNLHKLQNAVFGSWASFQDFGSCEFVQPHDLLSSVGFQSNSVDFPPGDTSSRAETIEILITGAKLFAWLVVFRRSKIQNLHKRQKHKIIEIWKRVCFTSSGRVEILIVDIPRCRR